MNTVRQRVPITIQWPTVIELARKLANCFQRRSQKVIRGGIFFGQCGVWAFLVRCLAFGNAGMVIVVTRKLLVESAETRQRVLG